MSGDFGEIIMTLNHLDMVRTVVRADPVALISDVFLDELHESANNFMRLDMTTVNRWLCLESSCLGRHPGNRCYLGALVYITPAPQPDEDSRNYIYRIGPYNWERNAWEARWVD
jgi:hypothetical protein